MDIEDGLRLVQSQPPALNGGSSIHYHWVCLFSWCENNPTPFDLHVREITEGYIPESWFTKPLSPTCRHQKAKFPPLGKEAMSVFCKVEYGKPLKITYNYLSTQFIISACIH